MKSEFKKIAALGFVLLAASMVIACLGTPERTGKPTVIATIFPYYDALRVIGGEQINAELLLDASTDVHDYTASIADKSKVDSARLIIRNGLQLDDWQVFSGSKAKMVIIADGLPAESLGKTQHDGHAHANPHIWLDPLIQLHAAEKIRDALKDMDPEHAKDYEENAAKYISSLRDLHQKWSDMANELPASKKAFIGFHDAYQYLATRYGFKQVATVEEADKSGLTPAQIELVKTALKEKKANVIFAEDDASMKNIKSIVGDSNVTIGILLPLEHGGKDDTYVSLMKQNLEAMKKAMQ